MYACINEFSAVCFSFYKINSTMFIVRITICPTVLLSFTLLYRVMKIAEFTKKIVKK